MTLALETDEFEVIMGI